MFEKFFSMLSGLSNEWMTIVVAALPVAELRGSIPLAILSLKMPVWKTFWLSILGNMLPVIPFLLILNPATERLRNFGLWRKFFERIFERTKKKAALVQKYEALGLALFVAVPLPMTGAWSGCIAASLFKIKFRYALLAITAGVLIAGLIVTAVTLAGRGIFFQLFLAR